jgi:hypothetical protein
MWIFEGSRMYFFSKKKFSTLFWQLLLDHATAHATLFFISLVGGATRCTLVHTDSDVPGAEWVAHLLFRWRWPLGALEWRGLASQSTASCSSELSLHLAFGLLRRHARPSAAITTGGRRWASRRSDALAWAELLCRPLCYGNGRFVCYPSLFSIHCLLCYAKLLVLCPWLFDLPHFGNKI